MQLLNVNIIGQEGSQHIHIENGKIRNITNVEITLPVTENDVQLTFNSTLAFPGLINSHDHLDFNLFPQLGNKIYQNYIEWGADIHLENKGQINSVLKIPEPLRIRWGIYKNLLAGITTVVNHGKRITSDNDLINIFQESQTIHSIQLGKNWKFHLNKFYKKRLPIVIHIGEGTDTSTHHEINHLLKWNYFKRNLIGIHCVAMNEKQAASFKALVWCPASNDFLLGKTAAIDILKQQAVILFGTDSTLSAPWNLWDHLRLAKDKKLVTDTELFDMLTINPAKIWNMNDRGRLTENQWADIVVAKPGSNSTKWDAFYHLNPEDMLLILHRGNIRLFDVTLLDQVKKNNISMAGFSKIYINGIAKYIQGDLPGLMNEILKYNPDIKFPVTSE